MVLWGKSRKLFLEVMHFLEYGSITIYKIRFNCISKLWWFCICSNGDTEGKHTTKEWLEKIVIVGYATQPSSIILKSCKYKISINT